MAAKKETKTPSLGKTAKQSQPKKLDATSLASLNDKKVVARSSVTKRTNALSVPMFTLEGTAGGNLDLPKEIFGVKVNKALLSQALRVYNNNQKGHFSNTKTRGEVAGSTRKIFRQKGTGHARHGGIRAPIFVGGGIALGPKSRKVVLDLPKKMKKAALVAALSQKTLDNAVVGVSGLNKSTGKTKQMINLAWKMRDGGKSKSVLFVIDQANQMAARAVRNIQGIEVSTVEQLNVFEVIKHQSLVLSKEAVVKLEERIAKGEK